MHTKLIRISQIMLLKNDLIKKKNKKKTCLKFIDFYFSKQNEYTWKCCLACLKVTGHIQLRFLKCMLFGKERSNPPQEGLLPCH